MSRVISPEPAVKEAASKVSARSATAPAARSHRPASAAASILRLQRTHGNRYVGGFLLARGVQAKLTVNEPGDQYEREADRVAEQVMGMNAPCGAAAADAPPHPEGLRVSRARTCCGEEEGVQRLPKDGEPGREIRTGVQVGPAAHSTSAPPVAVSPAPTLQRQGVTAEEEPDDPENRPVMAVRRKSLDGGRADAGGGQSGTEELPEGRLQTGGEPLPPHVQTFFEGRFGRDFSDVRVHTGAESEKLNRDVHAYAFTYGHHIWLGEGRRAEPSFLLAHELTHVVQQKQPPLLHAKSGCDGSCREESARAPEAPGAAGLSVQRFLPFWEPYDVRSGGQNHSLVLPDMGRANSIFTEAPVANSNKTSPGYGQRGEADFYRASTIVGLYFTGHHTARPLNPPSDFRMNGERPPPTLVPAPALSPGGLVVTNVALAPTNIRLGDLKPSHGTIEAAEGPAQLANYAEGFQMAQREVNSMSTGATWSLSVGSLGSGDLIVPARFVFPTASGQPSRRLVLKQGSSTRVVWNPPTPVLGKQFVAPDPANAGIWNYFWVPDSAVSTAGLPRSVRQLGPQVVDQIVDPLLSAPVQPAPKAKPGPRARPAAARAPAPPAGPQVSHNPAPVIRRRAPRAVPPDNFNFQQWREHHQQLTQGFTTESRTREFREAEGSLLAVRAQEALRDRAGVNLPAPPEAARTDARTLQTVEFWTGRSALVFGHMRRLFGRAFVTVARLYVRIKERFTELLRGARRAGARGGLLGAALNAAFKVIKLAGAFVIGRTLDRLYDSLATGVTDKLRALVGDVLGEELEQKVAQVTQLREELERRAVDSAEALLQEVVGPYLATLREVEQVQRAVSDIVQIVNLVRWGARVIACLSPPAWGCLWILGEAALDRLAAEVVETCWFQRRITPLIGGIDFVANLPSTLADMIIRQVRRFLPHSLHDIFANVDRSRINVGESDVACEQEDGERYRLTDERRELLELQQSLGEERYRAFVELSRRAGIPDERPLTAEQIRRIGALVRDSGLTAQQVRAYAERYPEAPEGMPTDVGAFLEAVRSGAALPPPSARQPAAGTTRTPPAQGPSAGTAEAVEGGGGIPVAEARERAFEAGTRERVPHAAARVVNPLWSHVRGSEPLIDIMGFLRGEAVILVRSVRTRVVRRTYIPSGSTEATATHLSVHYELLDGVHLSPIPGGFPRGRVIQVRLPMRR
ncbi:MAG TPA: DUF4157 domain-containing protein [Pyrinomonadaceae bacterium]|nr:DUF4157 domain-containing protein [Pyrinomonadaceae bacterium]